MFRLRSIAFLIVLTGVQTAMAQAPARDPNTPGYVTAKDWPDGVNAPAKADGNFILGPTHNPAPEMTAQDAVPQGTVSSFTMASADSRIYPGIARDANNFGTAGPADPAKLVVTTSHPAPYTRRVSVYVPKQYVPGTAAPFIVGADLIPALFTALDNLIAQHWVPVMIAVSISNSIRMSCADNMHDWVVANENMATVLAAKGYHYQFVFALFPRNAGHTDRAVKQQTLPEALEYVWQGYPVVGPKN